MNRQSSILNRKLFVLCVLCVLCGLIFASTTTFNNVQHSYFGRVAITNKLVVTITPEANDVNSISSTAISTDSYFGTLERITIAKTGTDTSFRVIVKDGDSVSLFSKTDCNSVLLPLSYALIMADTAGSKYLGIPVAGPLTIDTNDVDPNNLTSIILTFYYRDWRY